MRFEQFDLTGQTALITGGAGLLGIEHATALLECGANVVVTDVDLNSLIEAKQTLQHQEGAQSRLFIEEMDVTSREVIVGLQEKISETLGNINILINNAAIDPKMATKNDTVEPSRFEHFSLEQWNFELTVGLTGAYLCSQIFGSSMASSGGGVILNIASDLSVIAPDQRLYKVEGMPERQQPVKPVSYSVIKTGLIGLTKYLATYWADKYVRVNALSPGGVYTDQSQEFVDRLSQLIPLGRMAYQNEYRAAVQFLCSKASSYMTGQNIVIDGGRSVL